MYTLTLSMKNSGARIFLWWAQTWPFGARMPWPSRASCWWWGGLPKSNEVFVANSFDTFGSLMYKIFLFPIENTNVRPINKLRKSEVKVQWNSLRKGIKSEFQAAKMAYHIFSSTDPGVETQRKNSCELWLVLLVGVTFTPSMLSSLSPTYFQSRRMMGGLGFLDFEAWIETFWAWIQQLQTSVLVYPWNQATEKWASSWQEKQATPWFVNYYSCFPSLRNLCFYFFLRLQSLDHLNS